MMRPVRMGLIGVGGIGRMHLSAIGELAREGRVVLAAVADPVCASLPEELRLQLADVAQYPDYRQMLDSGHALDAVVIATPIHFHFEMAREILSRGHYIYLEKPPVPLIQQLDELIALDSQGQVAVSFQQLASESLQKLKRWILDGRLGEVHDIRATGCWPRLDHYYSRASWAGRLTVNSLPVLDGPATNALAHVLHNIMFLGGETTGQFGHPVEVRAEIYRARPIDSYDTICMRGRLESGPDFAVAFSHASRDSRPWQIEVRGSRGIARIREDRDSQADEFTLRMQRIQEVFAQAYENFVDFAGGRIARPLTRPADARGYVLATNGALLSSDGIHDIPPPHAERFTQTGDSGYDIAGVGGLMDQVLHEGLLFSEQGTPWAVATRTVSTENLNSIPFTEIVAEIREKRSGRNGSAEYGEVSPARNGSIQSV